jgi:hypothetical protein
MANQSKDKKNQPPTGEGKQQSPRSGEDTKLDKRSEVTQAQRGHSELNMGTEKEETAARGERMEERGNPERKKAGR